MQLNDIQVLTCCLLCAAAVLLLFLILVLVRLHAQRRWLGNRLKQFENSLFQSEQAQREEQFVHMYQLNDQVVQSVRVMGQAQHEQMSSLISQNFESAQAADQRQHTMQRITEESLKRIEERIRSVEESLVRSLGQQEQRLEAIRQSTEDQMRQFREENSKKLSEMRATVDEKLTETLEKRLNSSFSQVSERLEQVYRSLGEVHSLATGVGDLKRMLGNVKSRGVWGEVQLGALLEQVLTEKQYQRNVAVSHTSERVEFAVCLPGKDGEKGIYLPIDSKFPQEDYVRLVNAAESGDPQAVEAAQKALMNAVKTEAKRIGKYIVPPYTTDFAVMFLPLEGLYAEVMRHSDVVESIQREQRILISGPSTLLALLNSLQMGFRTLAIEQRSAEVWKLLGAVKSDFGSFGLLLEKTHEKLQQATASIDSAFTKTRTIEKRLRNVEALQTTEADLLLSSEENE